VVRRRLARLALPVVVGFLPAALLGLAVVRFTLNHFFFRAPFLLDAGFLSKLTYHDGLVLPVPRIACDYASVFYDIYVSPMTSMFSALSYLAPVGRCEWFAVVEGAVYAPIGLAVYLIASRLEPESALRRLPITFAAAVAFSFSGPVLWMVGYPHLEAAMPVLACVAVGAVISGRTRAAWVCLVLAASVRQDGGIHVALALAPLWFLGWRGVAMTPTRRLVRSMIGVAIGLSVTGMICQRLFFHAVPRLTQAYLGSPPYSHLSLSVLADRARFFCENNQLIYYPFVATCVVAAVRRDWRYLLGWISLVPWFAFSFAAVEEVKVRFGAYNVGPFLYGPFWLYAYGAGLAPPGRRLRAGWLEAIFALVCASSTYGAYRGFPSWIQRVATDMTHYRVNGRASVHAFVDALQRNQSRFTRLRVDDAVAALAIEFLPADAWLHTGATDSDAVAFHLASEEGRAIEATLTANRLDTCTLVLDTHLVLCTHDGPPAGMFDAIATATVPSSFVLAVYPWKDRDTIAPVRRGVAFRRAGSLRGGLGVLPAGDYEWTIEVAADEPVQATGPELVGIDVVQGDALLASGTAAANARAFSVRLHVAGDRPLEYELRSRADSPVTITAAQLRLVDR